MLDIPVEVGLSFEPNIGKLESASVVVRRNGKRVLSTVIGSDVVLALTLFVR